MTRDERYLVAFDTGIFRAGLFSSNLVAGENLCPIIVEFARRRAFTVVVLNTVIDELCDGAAREGRLEEIEAGLLSFLGECHTLWEGPLTSEDLLRHKRRFWESLRHEADAEVAVEVFLRQPDYLVQCNPRHWGRIRSGAMGSVSVVSPRRFLRELGVSQIPPPTPRRPRQRG